MPRIILSEATIKAIRDDADLYASVIKAVKCAPTYLATLLRKKDDQLTNLNVLNIISAHTGMPVNELTEEEIAEGVES